MRARKKRLIILVVIAVVILMTGIVLVKFFSTSKQVKSPNSSQDTTKSQTNQNNINKDRKSVV
jgi:flagellar basal body-associated protein FliL